MTAVAADAFRLARNGTSVVAEFGRRGAGSQPGDVASIAVSDRVVLSLETARRLLVWLDDAIKPHAAMLRAEEAKALSPEDAAAAVRPGREVVRPVADAAGEKGALLLRLVAALGGRPQYERSFRLTEGTLQANRFLLSLDAAEIAGNRRARVLEVCDAFAMPQGLRAAAVAAFAIAHSVHFGFERQAESIVCKLYFEREVPAEEARLANAGGQPALLHQAYKWSLDGKVAVTCRYWWFPGLSAAGIEQRLEGIYRGDDAVALDMARATLRLGLTGAAAEALQYLEVEEDDNPRRSFDINLYNSRLQVKDALPILQRMRAHFAVRPGQFQAVYDQVKALALGHLAGGVHRGGNGFFNVYYGVSGMPVVAMPMRGERELFVDNQQI
jgi:hypothetical protein